jgi:hypothetical protein
MPAEMLTSSDDSIEKGSGIFYFGYGAIVNSVSRARRGVETLNEKPATLQDYQLTFAYGGAANILRKRGWSVHGVVMECKTAKDWELLKEFDAGYDCLDVDVYPYDGDADKPVRAHAFVMALDESENAELPTTKLPQERYIRIIAAGMRHYGVDDEYIDYSILNVPYIPNRKPKDYLSFPQKISGRGKLKMISYKEYERKAKKNTWFLIGNRIIQLGEHDPNSNFIQMLMARVIGKPDATFVTLQTLFDPDLPLCESPDDIQPLHIAWAENQMVDTFEQAELAAMTVGLVNGSAASSARDSSVSRLSETMKRFSIIKK